MTKCVPTINIFSYKKKFNILSDHLSFDIFGFLTLETVDLLQRIQRLVQSNVVSPRSIDKVLKRINFAILKKIATEFIVCLPSFLIKFVISDEDKSKKKKKEEGCNEERVSIKERLKVENFVDYTSPI